MKRKSIIRLAWLVISIVVVLSMLAWTVGVGYY